MFKWDIDTLMKAQKTAYYPQYLQIHQKKAFNIATLLWRTSHTPNYQEAAHSPDAETVEIKREIETVAMGTPSAHSSPGNSKCVIQSTYP